MNKIYVKSLLECNRFGKVIRLIRDNIYEWSVDDYDYIMKICHKSCQYVYHHIGKESLYNDLKRKLEKFKDMYNPYLLGLSKKHIKYIILAGHSDIVCKYMPYLHIKNRLYQYVKYNYIFMVKYLLLSGYDIDKIINILYSGIHGAYRLGSREIIKYLTSHVMLNKYTYKLSPRIIQNEISS